MGSSCNTWQGEAVAPRNLINLDWDQTLPFTCLSPVKPCGKLLWQQGEAQQLQA